MLQFKTNLSSIILDETIKIERKGKSPLQEEYSKIFINCVHPQENHLYFIVGAYGIDIKVSLTETMRKEILDWFNYGKITNNVTIKADKITIKNI